MMKKITFILGLVFIGLLASYFLLNNILYNSTFEYEHQPEVNYSGISRESVGLSTGEKIDLAFNKKNDGLVFVYFHGNTGRTPYIINFLKDNYSFISPAYPGYSQSSGKPSVANVYETVTKTKIFINKNFKNRKIYVIGHSLGSQAAFYYGIIENNINTLAIVEGFDSIYNICKDRLKKVNFACIVAKNSFNAKKMAQKNYLPFTFISFHSPEDEVISVDRGIELYNSVQSKEKIFFDFENGEHGEFDIKLVTDIMLGNA